MRIDQILDFLRKDTTLIRADNAGWRSISATSIAAAPIPFEPDDDLAFGRRLRAIIGFNAVVLKDVPSGATAVGVPARNLVNGVPYAQTIDAISTARCLS